MAILRSNVNQYGGFIGSINDFDAADTVILGAPMDYTVSFRPGTRMGPQRIREVSYGIELYSVYQDKTLADRRFYDSGDLVLPFGNVKAGLSLIEQAVAEILAADKFPLILGGEHLITLPVVRAMAAKYKDLVVLHFDAHADLRTEFFGEKESHATVLRHVADIIGGKNLYQFGIRSGVKEEFEYARENTNMFVDEVLEPLETVIPLIKDRPVYITLDIDVVDPAYVPGTGTPEPGGCTSKEILTAVVKMGQLNVVGFDLVEVSPHYDISDKSSLLAAKIVREAICAYR